MSGATATPESPIVYVSPSCKHCRALLVVINQSGAGGACRFVNVDEAMRLPRFVDRVPLLFDGTSVFTDGPLFKLFPGRGSTGPREHANVDEGLVAAVDPGPGLGGGFSSSFAGLDGCEPPSGNMWLVDGAHESIETPECEPMPKKSSSSSVA